MNDRLARYQKGHRSELWAMWFLRAKGYSLAARRYKTKVGEIDLVMIKGKTIVFCEVKARAQLTEGLEAVSTFTQQRIMRAAEHFAQKHRKYQKYDWRFDALVVRPYRLPYHLKDAWRASARPTWR